MSMEYTAWRDVSAIFHGVPLPVVALRRDINLYGEAHDAASHRSP